MGGNVHGAAARETYIGMVRPHAEANDHMRTNIVGDSPMKRTMGNPLRLSGASAAYRFSHLLDISGVGVLECRGGN